MTKKCPNLMKSIYLHIQKTHQTLWPITQRPHLDSYNQMKKVLKAVVWLKNSLPPCQDWFGIFIHLVSILFL